MESADYLITEYYPKTQIDTEIIIKTYADNAKWKQNYVLYNLLKRKMELQDPQMVYPPRALPVVYQA